MSNDDLTDAQREEMAEFYRELRDGLAESLRNHLGVEVEVPDGTAELTSESAKALIDMVTDAGERAAQAVIDEAEQSTRDG